MKVMLNCPNCGKLTWEIGEEFDKIPQEIWKVLSHKVKLLLHLTTHVSTAATFSPQHIVDIIAVLDKGIELMGREATLLALKVISGSDNDERKGSTGDPKLN